MSGSFLERLGQGLGLGGGNNDGGNGGNGGNQPPANSGGNGQNNGDFTGMNGQGNNGGNNNGNNGGNEPPKDPFADLFTNIPDDPAPAPLFDKVDPKKINEYASTQNFLNGVDRNLLTKVQEGGEAGTRAMLQIMQQVAANAFTAATSSTVSLVEDGARRSADGLRNELPQHMRNEASRQALNQELMKDPSISPMVESIRGIIAKKFPDAHPSEVARKTEEYFKMVAGKFGTNNGGSSGGNNNSGNIEEPTDWEAFFRE